MGVLFGLILTVVWNFLEKRILLKKIQTEADQILQEAQDKAEEFFNDHEITYRKENEKKWNIFEKEKEILKSNLDLIQNKINRKHHEIKIKTKELGIQNSQSQKKLQDLKKEKRNIFKEKRNSQFLLKELVEKKMTVLKDKFSFNINEIKESLEKKLKEDWISEKRSYWFDTMTQDSQQLKRMALFYLNLVLNRFQRSSCSERGVFFIKFNKKSYLQNLLGPNKSYINYLEKECGVDAVVDKENLQVFVFGLDPVRREWGRRCLEKLSSRNKINLSLIKKIIKLTKKDLFSNIKRDGINICKRLNIKDVAVEVQNMMGALRYRYSFTQNQYFHCEEVGWLCGLLSAELSLPIKPSKRSGMFHDIGKAMDHSIEGNHAMIGADFLSQYKEDKDILHAVRAHHYDETPSTVMAYLVIVADSISGSRLGARRFTEDSYAQKIARLKEILNNFKSIKNFYIMNGGREIRLVVDPEKVSDKETVELSREIAKKVEKECSYPGLIKITAIRKSETYATA